MRADSTGPWAVARTSRPSIPASSTRTLRGERQAVAAQLRAKLAELRVLVERLDEITAGDDAPTLQSPR